MSLTNWSRVTVTVISVVLIHLLPASAQAQKILPEGIKDLATQIATNVAKEQKHKIAVLPFRELDGRATVLGTYIAEELVTDLFTIGGLDIVERSMLDRLLGEAKLGETGVIDPETATKVGKIAGVDAIVTGTITDLQSYVALNCRLIDARTGRIFGAAQAKIVKDDDVRKIMGVSLSVSPTPKSESASGPETSPEASAKPDLQRQESNIKNIQRGMFLFGVQGCQDNGGILSCSLTVTNRSPEAARINLCSSELLDNFGRELRARVDFGRGGGTCGTTLESDLPRAFLMTTRDISPDAISVTIILKDSSIGGLSGSAILRDIPISRRRP